MSTRPIQASGGVDRPAIEPGERRESADELSFPAALFVACVTGAATVCIITFAPQMSWDGWQGFVTLIFVAIAFERIGIKIYGDTHVSAGVVALLAISMLYGPAGAAIAAPIVVLGATVRTDVPWHSRLFDMGSYTCANTASALVLEALVGIDSGLSGWWIPATVSAVVVNYAVNASLVAGLASLYSGEHWWKVWQQEHRWLFSYYIVFGFLGLALAAAYDALQVPGILAFATPPLMMRFALHEYVTKTEKTVLELKEKYAELEAANHSIIEMTQHLTETYDGTLEALVLALDARDRETKGHSFRVAKYVVEIARAMGVRENSAELVDMQRGALLHDVGKIGVPDFILHKPGPLSPEEWEDMKRHPHTGFDMLKDISFLKGAADIVRTHHERFDGKGYPAGLHGEDIPLGSRVFTIADAFDAMTSDRPYRKALPPEMARAEIIRHSGTQFDPKVVQTFLNVFDAIERLSSEEDSREHEAAA